MVLPNTVEAQTALTTLCEQSDQTLRDLLKERVQVECAGAAATPSRMQESFLRTRGPTTLVL